MSEDPEPYHVAPQWITVPLPKGCLLVLSQEEYVRVIKRGKRWRQREAFARQQALKQTAAAS